MIFIASDHGGFKLKENLKKWFKKTGVQFIDGGTHSVAPTSYGIFARKAVQAVLNKTADKAILICGTGIGMSIQANRFKGIRAAAVGASTAFAHLSREHNNANVLCLSGRFASLRKNKKIVSIFLKTNFAGGRHTQRIELFDKDKVEIKTDYSGAIVLSSNGIMANNQKSKNLFLNISNGKSVFVVANAANQKSGNFKNRSETVERFKKSGAKSVEIKEIIQSDVKQMLSCDVIYIMGGQIANLLETVQKLKLALKFKKFLNGGGIIAGESAGAMVLGPDIAFVYKIKKGLKPKYDYVPKKTRGLNLTCTRVFPHLSRDGEETKQKALTYEDSLGKLAALEDGEFIVEYL